MNQFGLFCVESSGLALTNDGAEFNNQVSHSVSSFGMSIICSGIILRVDDPLCPKGVERAMSVIIVLFLVFQNQVMGDISDPQVIEPLRYINLHSSMVSLTQFDQLEFDHDASTVVFLVREDGAINNIDEDLKSPGLYHYVWTLGSPGCFPFKPLLDLLPMDDATLVVTTGTRLRISRSNSTFLTATDPWTRIVLFKMLNQGVFSDINGCILGKR
ncbi:hypothetical protein Nepgr_033504 [Nepenthes gracilis]|uniref:Uncharacterized protein n=1 Tax=Nepenthes gracilis TaxID=150966 RepID=A0AAD3TLA8_NEPGR|nr:hypothetical protein Nepgr_033504 [Nepenthes gracilis]